MAKKPKMMFKNVLAFRLPKGWRVSAEALADQLDRCKFHPCGSQEEQSRGFTQPRGDEYAPLVHAVGGQYLILLQEQKRMLPASVIKDALTEKAKQITEQQGYAPGRKQLKELKEEVRQELLPKAFLKNTTTRAWLNPDAGWLVIEAGVGAKADAMLEALAKALDDFPARRLNTNTSPEAAMADWLTSGDAPAGFSIDRDCELKSPAEEKAAVRYVRHALDGQDVRDHLAQGKRPTRLALTFNDRVSFVLTEKQELKGLKLIDIGEDSAAEADDAEDLFNAEFTLMAGEYTQLLDAITEALGGEAPDA